MFYTFLLPKYKIKTKQKKTLFDFDIILVSKKIDCKMSLLYLVTTCTTLETIKFHYLTYTYLTLIFFGFHSLSLSLLCLMFSHH